MKYLYSLLFLFIYHFSIAQNDTIHLTDPFEGLAISISDSIGCVPMQVRFSTTLSDSIRFRWEFGDGETSILKNPTHTYLRAGSYTITFVAYSKKDSIVLTKQEWVNAYPVVYPNFNTASKCVCNTPAQVSFFNNSNSSAHYKWLFDGAEITEYEGFNPPIINYPEIGKYDVSLIATTEQGCIDTLKIEKFVNIGHSVDFSADKTVASCPPFPVAFTDKSKGCAVKWKWDFGDGTSPSFSQDPVHIYTKAGTYTVRLNVIYDGGCEDSLIQTDLILVGGPSSSMQVQPLEACENEAISFKYQASGYLFLELAPNEVKLLKGNPNSPLEYFHKFKQAGAYLPSYTVIDSSGCLHKFTIPDSIRIIESPKTDFSASPLFGKKPLDISLASSTENDYNFRWFVINKNDTLESTERKPYFTLEKVGRYTVQMIAFHSNGCSDTLKKKEYVAIVAESGQNNLSATPISATIVTEQDGSEDLNVTINSIEKHIFNIEILNENGNTDFTETLPVQGLKSIRIKTRHLIAGNYTISIKEEDGKEVLKKNFGKK